MTDKTLFRWEQDGSGGEHGTATYWPGTIYEINVPMPTFKQAHELQVRIEWVLIDARFNARRELLEQIGKNVPIESTNMTARKAFELAAILLLPGVLLYGAGAFVSLEWDFREWSAEGRFALLSFWVALATPLVIAWDEFRAWKEFR